MAKPTPESLPSLLVTELWGLGDLALAMPFLRTAVQHARVTLVAKPHAAPLLRRFAPEVNLVPLVAPWTAFTGKYRLHRWPWKELRTSLALLKAAPTDLGVSARPDPRDHGLLRLAGARQRLGFARAGSRLLLTHALPIPTRPHRAAHWETIAAALGWPAPSLPLPRTGPVRRILMHTGAGQAVRQWPVERFHEIAARLRASGLEVTVIDDRHGSLDQLMATLASADAFIGNDSGPGHLAALLGVPTFTIFGPQLPALFAPQHPQAAWTEGAPCPYKPCFDRCRYDTPHCLSGTSVETVWSEVTAWLSRET